MNQLFKYKNISKILNKCYVSMVKQPVDGVVP